MKMMTMLQWTMIVILLDRSDSFNRSSASQYLDYFDMLHSIFAHILSVRTFLSSTLTSAIISDRVEATTDFDIADPNWSLIVRQIVISKY